MRDLADDLVAVTATAALAKRFAKTRHMRRNPEGFPDVVRLEERAVVREHEAVRSGHVCNVREAWDRRRAGERFVADSYIRRERETVHRDRGLATETLVITEDRWREDVST